MTSFIEIAHRVQRFLRFSKQELSSIIILTLVTAFIFSFRDWGGTEFNFAIGLQNFITLIVVAAITILFKLSCQKIYGLSVGYKAEFKIWWTGLVLVLILAFITIGHVPLILAGTMVTALMVKQRLGEFRYGMAYEENAWVGLWGVYGCLILAILFSIGAYYLPESYFFSKGVILTLIFAITSLIPIPQLDGLNIIWGTRFHYGLALFASLLAPLLLLSHKINLVPLKTGLILAIILGLIGGIIYILLMSEK